VTSATIDLVQLRAYLNRFRLLGLGPFGHPIFLVESDEDDDRNSNGDQE
jgi:hypothetical protein